MRPLRVMLVMEATEGGTARYLAEVAKALCEAGLSVHVVCAARRCPEFRNVMRALEGAGALVTELDMWREIRPREDARAIRELRRLFCRSRSDVIHLHSSKAGALGRIGAILTRTCPVVYTPHAYGFLDDSRPVFARLVLSVERVLGRWTDHLVAVSDSERDQTLRHRLVPAARVTVIPNGLRWLPDEDLMRRAARSPARAGPHIRVGHLGRLEWQKDPIQLIHLAASLEQRGLSFQLDIGGAGALRAACERCSEASGLCGKVRFLGHVADTPAFYRSIDIFTCTSRYEGLPYSVLDAMSWALPVVAFNVPGVKDAVISGVTGLLVQPGAIDQLADAVVRLAKDPALRSRMGQGGRQRVAECFRLDRQVRQLQTVYETLAEKRTRPQPASTATRRVSPLVPMAGMRVLYVSDCGFLGGAERSLLELMEEARRYGVQPLLMCPDRSALARAAKMLEVRVIDSPLRRLRRPRGTPEVLRAGGTVVSATVGLLRVLRREKIDIVHANSTTAQLQVGMASRLARTPCIWHWRDFYDFPRVNRVLARTADMSIAISQSVYEFALAQLGPEAPLVMIRNGLEDPQPLREAHGPSCLRSGWGVTNSDTLIGLIGQAIPRKGHEVFIRAMGEVVAHRRNLRAILLCTQLDAGGERYVSQLHRLAHEVRCHDRIIFADPSDNIPAVLRALDIVVVPSLREPFGRVAVEAMLAERPVVASAVDGLTEIVVDTQTGLLVPPGDGCRLAAALVRLVDNPHLRYRMGQAGRERALEHFCITRTASDIVDCYHRLRHGVS